MSIGKNVESGTGGRVRNHESGTGLEFESGTRLARVRNSWPTSRELNMQLASGTEALSLQLGARVESWS